MSLRDAVGLVQLVAQPGETLGLESVVHQHPPGLDELARRIGLDDLAVDGTSVDPHRLHPLARGRHERPARLEVDVHDDRRTRTSSVHSGLVIASHTRWAGALM